MPVLTCREPLLFDRNSGTCVDATFAPCGAVNNPPGPQCPPSETGFFPFPNSCTKFIFCLNGDLRSKHECQDGWHFNPVEEICDLPENLPEPCVARDNQARFYAALAKHKREMKK